MRGETILAALVLGLAWARPALSAPLTASVDGDAVPQRAHEIRGEVGDLRDAVASPLSTDEKVVRRAYDLFNEGVPASQIAVQVKLRGWDKEREISGTPADANRIVQSAQRRLMEIKELPAPEFTAANNYAKSMNGTPQLAFEGLDAKHMGVYRYSSKSPALGSIKLSEVLSGIAALVGDVFAFATVIHETAHARDHQAGKLRPDAVLDGEVSAFQTQYLWLKMIDPYGERLAWIRLTLAEENRLHPSAVTAAALNYATSLHVLEGTKGEEGKVREYVEQLGYKEGEHSHELGHPSA